VQGDSTGCTQYGGHLLLFEPYDVKEARRVLNISAARTCGVTALLLKICDCPERQLEEVREMNRRTKDLLFPVRLPASEIYRYGMKHAKEDPSWKAATFPLGLDSSPGLNDRVWKEVMADEELLAHTMAVKCHISPFTSLKGQTVDPRVIRGVKVAYERGVLIASARHGRFLEMRGETKEALRVLRVGWKGGCFAAIVYLLRILMARPLLALPGEFQRGLRQLEGCPDISMVWGTGSEFIHNDRLRARWIRRACRMCYDDGLSPDGACDKAGKEVGEMYTKGDAAQGNLFDARAWKLFSLKVREMRSRHSA
jgi:hypothetical protein